MTCVQDLPVCKLISHSWSLHLLFHMLTWFWSNHDDLWQNYVWCEMSLKTGRNIWIGSKEELWGGGASVQTAPADPIPDATYSYKHHQGGKWYLLLCIYDKSDKTTNNRYIPNSPPPPCIIKAYKFTTDIPKTEARHKNARMQDCNYQWKWMRKCYIEV